MYFAQLVYSAKKKTDSPVLRSNTGLPPCIRSRRPGKSGLSWIYSWNACSFKCQSKLCKAVIIEDTFCLASHPSTVCFTDSHAEHNQADAAWLGRALRCSLQVMPDTLPRQNGGDNATPATGLPTSVKDQTELRPVPQLLPARAHLQQAWAEGKGHERTA